MKKVIGMLTLALSLSLGLFSCDQINRPPAPQTSSSGAQTVNIGKQFKEPTNAQGNTVEQQQIMDRIKITSDPTRIMWLHRLSFDGKIVSRTPVRGKVTSSTKRLEPISVAAGVAGGEYHQPYGVEIPGGHLTTELIQADGTYGNSDAYIFWFDPSGHYFQLGSNYLLSDMPIDLDNPLDKITGQYNVMQAAADWQKQQEAKLKQ